ncbi:phage protein NinX family protein [Burkholderia multivorans]|uniref:phage protein NinX family protein n=1 Tax=Burkholderia multivorans TaxID=87883 RepID=UPI000CFF5EEC|nr:phage protein NinX family protein [Burkholderia multivorans]MBU9403553.1 DUF2591 domain-containing protein [Burkholderia multivorans]PRH21897.1 hypothetical protein C6T71_19550 [Burkholderia multivorans]
MIVGELSGSALDYWVCRALLAQFQGQKLTPEVVEQVKHLIGAFPFHPSTDWAAAAPIIERERIAFHQTWHVEHPYFCEARRWTAWTNGTQYTTEVEGDSVGYGPTQLVAAMRAFVASKFSDKVPDDLGRA